MRVLLLGKSPETMNAALELLRTNAFEAAGTTDVTTFYSMLSRQSYDVIAIGGAVDSTTRQTVHATCEALHSKPEVLDVFGSTTLLPKLTKLRDERKDPHGG